MFAPLAMIACFAEILVCSRLDFVLRGDADAGQVGVEIFRVEVTEFAVRLIHGDDAVHHHLSEKG